MTRVMRRVILASLMSVPGPAFSQGGQPAGEPFQLGALHEAAARTDPRAREFALLEAQSELRLRNIEVERLPALSAAAETRYQTDVPVAPLAAADGRPLFAQPKDSYDVSVRLDQRLIDPGNASRQALARAELAEARARLSTALFAVRQEVNDAFFAAALIEQQIGAIQASARELETRLREASARVREGAALPSDAAMIEATVLQHRQQELELETRRQGALDRLASLTGRTITTGDRLAVPELAAAVETARRTLQDLRARPEYAQFERMSERASRQQDLATAQERPQISAFARVGYGKPGLNFISDAFDSYALVGLQLQWKAWTWGSPARERQAQTLQQEIVAAEQESFTRGIRRSTEADLAIIDRLREILETGERIVGLRQSVERTALTRFQEGVLTASEYLDRTTERLNAEIDQARRRVELAQASARLLTTLGLEVR